METPNGPFDAPAHESDPGMTRPVVVLSMVFIVGLACVLLIYALGEPIRESEPDTAATQTQMQTPSEKTAAPTDAQTAEAETEKETTAPAQPYVSPGGGSPMPNHGEPEAPPISPTILADDATLNAPPPKSSSLPQPDGPVPWTEAHKYLDMTITVEGKILDTNNIGNICFLNYDPDWRDKFYIAMFKDAFELLPDPPETHYLDKTLRITGKVTLHNGRPQIKVHDLSQIEVVE